MDIATHEGRPPQHRAPSARFSQGENPRVSPEGSAAPGLDPRATDEGAPCRLEAGGAPHPSPSATPSPSGRGADAALHALAASALAAGCPVCGAEVAETLDGGVLYRCAAAFLAAPGSSPGAAGAVSVLLPCPAASTAAARRLTEELAETADFLAALAGTKSPPPLRGRVAAEQPGEGEASGEDAEANGGPPPHQSPAGQARGPRTPRARPEGSPARGEAAPAAAAADELSAFEVWG